MKTAIVLGATGLVGTEVVKLLQATSYYSSVLLLNRRPWAQSHPKISERIINFDAPDLDGVSGDHLYCALGTTLKKAGSKAEQFVIDCEYPTAIATRLRAQGTQRMILVSSVGADSSAANFYTRTKGQLEENIIALDFPATVIVRPSFLAGNRDEFRTGEEFATLLLKVASPFMVGALSKYRGIDAGILAACMVREAQRDARGVRRFEFDQMQYPEVHSTSR